MNSIAEPGDPALAPSLIVMYINSISICKDVLFKKRESKQDLFSKKWGRDAQQLRAQDVLAEDLDSSSNPDKIVTPVLGDLFDAIFTRHAHGTYVYTHTQRQGKH